MINVALIIIKKVGKKNYLQNGTCYFLVFPTNKYECKTNNVTLD